LKSVDTVRWASEGTFFKCPTHLKYSAKTLCIVVCTVQLAGTYISELDV